MIRNKILFSMAALIAVITASCSILPTGKSQPFSTGSTGHPKMTSLSAGSSTAILDKAAILNGYNSILNISHFPNSMYPNQAAYAPYDPVVKNFMINNVPFLQTPAPEFDQSYYYRWFSYYQHIKDTGNSSYPYVITEFYPQVGWAGIYSTINCAAAQHIYEGRWIRDTTYLNSYQKFWLEDPDAKPYMYSFWVADSSWNKFMVDGDTNFILSILADLKTHYAYWANTANNKYDASRNLYKQAPVWDGMESDVAAWNWGNTEHYRPTINSYMYGDAMAIAKISALAGNTGDAAAYTSLANGIKASMQNNLWNPSFGFFIDRNGTSFAWNTDREQTGFTPWYFSMPDSQYSSAWQHLGEFEGTYGLRTAASSFAHYKVGFNGDCYWDGYVWPFSSSITLTALANLLNNYSQSYVTKDTYYRDLYTYALSMHTTPGNAGTPLNLMEYLDPDTGAWEPAIYADGNYQRSYEYNHSYVKL